MVAEFWARGEGGSHDEKVIQNEKFKRVLRQTSANGWSITTLNDSARFTESYPPDAAYAKKTASMRMAG